MVDVILLESGDKLLLESGSFILLEIQSIPSQFKRIIITRSPSDFIIKSRNKPITLIGQSRITIRRKT